MIVTTFAASLLGSVHCAGMCGAFATIACLPGSCASANAPKAAQLTVESKPIDRSRFYLGACYNLGRGLTYTTLGAIAGALGKALDLGAYASGIGPVAAAAAGALLATIGVVLLLRAAGVPIPALRASPRWTARVARFHALALALEPRSRALAIGLLTPLLPCGWLYAFVATAAGTGNALTGAATMAAFWLGTLPFMTALTIGMRRITGPMAAKLPVASAIALIVVGLVTVFGRVWLPKSSGQTSGVASSGMICNDR